MISKFKIQVRHWVASIFARLFRVFANPSIEHEFAMLEDYLRIQRLRRFEEQRFLAQYMGPRL